MSNPALYIHTLGTLRIDNETETIEGFVTLKALLLFCYLAMNPGKHKRESLAPLLWSDTLDTQALKNLRTVLSSLRKTVPDYIAIDSETIEIKGHIWIDAQIFEAFCDKVFAGENFSLEEMFSGIELYTGEFLQDVYVRQGEGLEAWINYKRENLHQKYMQALYKLIERCLEEGELYQGVELARHLVRLNPLWEAAQRQLMLLLVHLNQSGEALMQYERLVTLLQTELDTEPESETIALYQKIKGHGIQASSKKTKSKIVLPNVPYIIPQKELNSLRQLLDKGDSRLISLIGFGGTGKSSLALFIAHERQRDYRDGAVFVPLSTVTNAQGLSQAILNALNIHIPGKTGDAQVIEELAERELLLVLDNYEQLLPETGLIKALLEAAPCIQIIVSSQIPLNVREEFQLPLGGLAIQTEALQLFRQTAERMVSNFDLTLHKETVLAICRELGGLPLGIVIAASQLKYLAPPEILKNLQENLLDIKASYQDLPERQQSFANLIHFSLKNLSEAEHHALLALIIFRGSFNHTAALAVAGMDMPLFIGLVDKSLIQSIGNFRYTLHGMLRRALIQDFEQLPDYQAIRQRFTNYYRDWCRWLYQQRLSSVKDFSLIDIEHENIWHLDLLNQHEKERYMLEILPTLQQYWTNRPVLDEVLEIAKVAVENEAHPADLRARGMVDVAMIEITRGNQSLSQILAEQAVSLDPDNLYVQVQAQQLFARITMQQGKHAEARQYLENVLDLESHKNRSNDAQMEFLFVGNHVGLGLILMNMGENELSRLHFNIAMQAWTQMNLPPRPDVLNNLALLDIRDKDYAGAQEKFLEVIESSKAIDNHALVMGASGNLGEMLIKTGDYADASHYLKAAIQIGMRLKRIPSVLYQIEALARGAFYQKHYTIAAQLRGFVLKSYDEYKLALTPDIVGEVSTHETEMQALLGERYQQLLASGKKLSLEAAIALTDALASKLESES